MKLSALTQRLQVKWLAGNGDIEVTDVCSDSRKISEGCVFVCIKGANFDGHDSIDEAAEKGAAAVVTQEGLTPENLPEGIAVAETAGTRRALALMSAAWQGYPAEKIPVIGITGTKGKTTTTYMVKSILESAGIKTGLIGTIETIIGEEHIHATNTTPESCIIHEYLRRMVDAGCTAAVMEVSSQALMMDRTYGIEFAIGVFTNLEPDHIGPNEHKDFEDYLHCKSLLFSQCRLGIVNADDEHTPAILKNASCGVTTYGIENEDADVRAEGIEHLHGAGQLGVTFTARIKDGEDFPVELTIPGRFSVYNALAAIAICGQFGIDVPTVQKALKEAKVKGRIEPVKVSDSFTLLIDYAHNAMALKSLLKSLREYRPNRLVCVFGCGGNRARSRRFEMGEASGQLADFTIITSDNPRFEEPQAIIDDIKTGIDRTDGEYIEIIDRREAIKYAIDNGRPGDIIVLAGKGHEDYQEICGVKHPMDERELIASILEEEGRRE